MTHLKPLQKQHPGTPFTATQKLNHGYSQQGRSVARWMLICLFWVNLSPFSSRAADLPCGFVDELVDDTLTVPLGIAFLPDGKALAWEQSGKIIIFDPNASPISPSDYMTIPNVRNQGESGALDVAVDPDFTVDPNPAPPANHYFYVYYIHTSNTHGRISRFTHLVDSDTGDPNSEFVVFEENDVDTNPSLHATRHVGAGLDFAPDGTIFLTTGDRDVPDEGSRSSSQDLTLYAGKILRLNKDGSIPDDNPFLGDANVLPEIYAYGLRNPFRARFDDVTGRLFVGDVGGNTQSKAIEEVNLGKKGANYGWPLCEGICSDPAVEPPLFSYNHNSDQASITGGVVYRGTTFPNSFFGVYFYGDVIRGWLRYLTFDNSGDVTNDLEFSPDIGPVLAIEQGPDGHLYYMKLGFDQPGEIRRIRHRIEPEPDVKITQPKDGATFAQNHLTAFMGIGCDVEDGDVAESLTWISDVDGILGSGGSFLPSDLSVGTHTITGIATDSSGLTGSNQITINVKEPIGTEILEVRVGAASDDAEERSSKLVSLGGGDLELGSTIEAGGGNQTVGMRFNDIDIPQTTNIVDAYVQFQVDEKMSKPTSLTIIGEASDSPRTFNSSPQNITSRPRTMESVTWMPDPWLLAGEADVAPRTPNITPIIQEIVNRPGWSRDNSLVIMIEGFGRREAVSYNRNQAGAPLLHIEYEINNQPPNVTISEPTNGATFTLGDSVAFSGTGADLEDGDLTAPLLWESDLDGSIGSGGSFERSDLSVGTHTIIASTTDSGGAVGNDSITITINSANGLQTIDVRVAAENDDAEERNSSGGMDIDSSDLELTEEGTNQTVGVRFIDLNIPNDAMIVDAYVQFQVDEVTTNVASLLIAGEDTDNAPIFTSSTDNISSRMTTAASVSWDPAPWTTIGETGPDQRTPNIASVIQEIVSRPGWSSGNSTAIIITGTGKRTAESHKGDPAGAALLHVEYTTN